MTTPLFDKMVKGFHLAPNYHRDVVSNRSRSIRDSLHETHVSQSLPIWQNEAGEQTWNSNRIKFARVVLSSEFETIMGLFITVNFCTIIFEADRDASCYPQYLNNIEQCPTASTKVLWLRTLNLIFLIIYTVEALLRLYALRELYFMSGWNYLDAFIVTAGWLQEVVGNRMNLAVLRGFRLARFFRAFRIFYRIRELYLLIRGFASSCKAIFFGMLMLFGMLLLFSVVLVELVHPVNSQVAYNLCPDCNRAYGSVGRATVTLFREVIAGGSWIISMPVFERSPPLGIVLVLVVVVTSLGTMNLILSVIVERAAEARDRDITDLIKQRDEGASDMKLKLLRICAAMDKNSDYFLSIEELTEAYDALPDFRNILKLMHVGRRDLHMVFELMDSDQNGKIDYQEFCEELYYLTLKDPRWASANMTHKVNSLRKAMNDKFDILISKFDASIQFQEKKLNAIEMALSDSMIHTPGVLVNGGVPPTSPPPPPPPPPPLSSLFPQSAEVVNEIDSKLHTALANLNNKKEFRESELKELESSSIDTLRGFLQEANSQQLRVASELQQLPGVLSQQSNFVRQLFESAPCAEKVLQQGTQVEFANFCTASRTERLATMMRQCLNLGGELESLYHETLQIGSHIDNVGFMMMQLGEESNAAGWEHISFDQDVLLSTCPI